MASCDTTNKYNLSNLCVITCRGTSAPFLAADGVNCAVNCTVAYSLNGAETQCVSTCAWPNGLYVNATYNNTVKMCSSTCPTSYYLNRANQNCTSTCSYVNATQTNGNNVCETAGNSSNCPFF